MSSNPSLDNGTSTSTPNALISTEKLPPSFSRRSSRPSILRLDHLQPSNILLEEQSPNSAKSNGIGQKRYAHDTGSPLQVVPPNTAVRVVETSPLSSMSSHLLPMPSPCFVHSHLD